ncbi:hypothetical protein [Citricoccus sp.]|uniref:hypothetical protein n=1 Tax=Citricoccus sp. TaxID=1978372 RepID=UPI0028BEBEA5|nr:hypothetical protein [Citricoccus sp.]
MNAFLRPTVKALGLAAAVLFGATACAQSEVPAGSSSGASETQTVTAPAEGTASPVGEPSPSREPSPSDDHSPSEEPSPDQDGTAASGPGSEPLPDDEINALSPYDDENAEPAFPTTDEVHVVGVPEDSSLNIRLTPGGPEDHVIASAGPMDRLTLTGREGFFVDEGGWWIEIVTDAEDGGDLYGWVSRPYVATFGPAADVTDDFADVGSGTDAEELMLQLADLRAPEGEPGPEFHNTGTERAIVSSPPDGAGTWTVDLIGGYRGGEADAGDKSHGERLQVQLQDSDGRFTVSSVQSTKLCSGEFDDDGVCDGVGA